MTLQDRTSAACTGPLGRRRAGPRRIVVATLLAGILVAGGATTAAAGPPTVGAPAPTTVDAPVVQGPAGRPADGAVLTRRGSGSGVLVVENGTGRDAVLTLSRGGRAVLVVYVHPGRTRTGSVPDGTFDVYAQTGRGWDPARRTFAADASAGRFDRRAAFETRRTDDGVRYTEVTLTLQPVPNGNSRIDPVPDAAVPA